MVPYDGSKSHIAYYNFCYLCKERLDTHRDEQDEGWYFVDTRQVRFTKHNTSVNRQGQQHTTPTSMVVNVHTTCLKEIEELNFSAKEDKNRASSSAAAQDTSSKVAATAMSIKNQKMEVEVATHNTLAGQKRKYVDAQIEEAKYHGDAAAEVDTRLGSSTAPPRISTEINSYYSQLINGLEQQKRRKLQQPPE